METNLEAVKDMSKLLFEAVPIEEVQQLKGLGIVQHPFVNSTHTINPQTGKMIDLRVSDQLQEYKEEFFKFLCAGDIYRILGMVNSGWKMTWFKHCCPFLSPKDYGELLAYCWVEQENPNQDVNVSRKLAVHFFRKARKSYIMKSSELKVYNTLPDTVTAYRGVAQGRERYGLSWTTDREKAEWFQNRFGEKNELLKAAVPKEHILAYFNRRGESEVVVDVFKIKKQIEEL